MELVRKLTCVLMRSGIEIWVEDERAEKLKKVLENKDIRFVDFDGEYINIADVSGIHTPSRMGDLTRRKNGQWKCEQGNWHEKFSKCECLTVEQIKARKEQEEHYKKIYGDGIKPL